MSGRFGAAVFWGVLSAEAAPTQCGLLHEFLKGSPLGYFRIARLPIAPSTRAPATVPTPGRIAVPTAAPAAVAVKSLHLGRYMRPGQRRANFIGTDRPSGNFAHTIREALIQEFL